MRKQVIFKLCNKDVAVPVDFDTIERIERCMGTNADMVATVVLPNMQTVAYSKLARCVADVVLCYSDLKREDVLNYVISAPGKELAQLSLNLQIACLYLRKEMTEDDFDAYARGESPQKKTMNGANS